MKKSHHQLIGLNALQAASEFYSVPNDLLSTVTVNHAINRKFYKKYLIAPDMIRDVYIQMPLWIDDVYDVYGANLTAFQHFIVHDQGYCWDKDDSLGDLDNIGDMLMTLLSTDIKYDDTVSEYGFSPAILSISPMALRLNGEINLDDFQFPSAHTLAAYYGDVVARQNKSILTRIRAFAFSLHFVMDACVPHHVRGELLNGHSQWESQLEKLWRVMLFGSKVRPFEMLQRMACQSINMLFTRFTDLFQATTIEAIVKANAAFTRDWMRSDNKISPEQAKFVCLRSIASCLVAWGL